MGADGDDSRARLAVAPRVFAGSAFPVSPPSMFPFVLLGLNAYSATTTVGWMEG